MSTAGYSNTPLLKKLGIKEGMKILLINPPGNYDDLLEANLSGRQILEGEVPDFIHLFAGSQKDFEREMKKIALYYKKNREIAIWVSWHKKSSGIKTDLTENGIRNYALKNELVDIKVCAVSELWSGLKLVVPVSRR